MTTRISPSLLIGTIAVTLATSVVALVGWQSSNTTRTLGFWFEPGSFEVSADVTKALGGPLSPTEIAVIDQLARAEINRAFSGMRVEISGDRNAFWGVAVKGLLKGRRYLPNAGESILLGPLGGTGAVSFRLIALKAIQFAPAESSREEIVAGIGRGIGRVAVHEFAHQIIGPAAPHNRLDESSYEYPSPDRASQYYGELRWTSALPLLNEKIGR
jgi:hypothetical protein